MVESKPDYDCCSWWRPLSCGAYHSEYRRTSIECTASFVKNIGILAYARCSLGIRVHTYDGPTIIYRIIVPVARLGGLAPAHPTMFLRVLVY